MTHQYRTRIAQFAAVVLALFAGSAAAAALGQDEDSRVAVVVAGTAAERPSVVVRAEAAAARAGAQLRVVHANADQLGVTHMLAARGYDTVVTVGVNGRTAIAPVAARYPGTLFIEADSKQLDRALSR